MTKRDKKPRLLPNTTRATYADGNEREPVKIPPRFRLGHKVVRDQLAVEKQGHKSHLTYYVNRAQVHEFNLTASIPTEFTSPSYLLHEVLGNSEDRPLLVSPEGGVVTREYFKPTREIERDTQRGGGYKGENPRARQSYDYKHTPDDTFHFWLTQAPEFREILVANGWMYFAPIQPVSEDDAKKIGVDPYLLRFREVRLSDLQKILGLTQPEEFPVLKADLTELSAYGGGDTARFYYKVDGGASKCFFRVPVKSSSGFECTLRLGEIEQTELYGVLSFTRDRDKPTTMQRTVNFGIGFTRPDIDDYFPTKPNWWIEDNTSRIIRLGDRYCERHGIDNVSRGLSKDGQHLEYTVSNRRDYTPEPCLTPDTGKFLGQVQKLRDFARSAVNYEHQAHAEQQAGQLAIAEIRLGLNK